MRKRMLLELLLVFVIVTSIVIMPLIFGAWGDVAFKEKIYFNHTGTSIRVPYRINSTQGLDGGIVWTLPQDNFSSSTNYSEYLYYNSYSDINVVNASENQQLPHDVESGGATSYNPSGVWGDIGKNLTIHFKEGSGATASDSSPLAQTCSGAINWVDGKFGYGTEVSSMTDGTCVIPDSADTDFEGKSLSVEAWVNATDDFSAYKTAVTKYRPGASNQEFSLGHGNTAKANWQVSDGSTRANLHGTTTLVANKWYYFVGICDEESDRVRIYVNGSVEYDESFATAGISKCFPDTSSPIVIGNNSEGDYWDGVIDEVRITQRVLTADEIKAMWEEGMYERSSLGERTEIGVGLTLNSPLNNSLENSLPVIFNITSFHTSLENTTLYIYDINDNFYAKNFTAISGTTNETVWSMNLIAGEYNWGVKSCATNGVCSSKNYTIYVGSKITSVVRDATVYETDVTTIKLNVTALAGYTPTALLVWNNTSYTMSSSNVGSAYSFTKTLDSPVGSGTIDFYFNLTTGSYVMYNGTYSHTLNTINFSFCSDTNNFTYLNISYKNETASQDYMNASVSGSTFNYWLGSGGTFKSFSYSTATESTNHSFCFTPDTEPLLGNVSYSYKSSDYPQRQWKNTFSLPAATTTQKILWLLGTNEGIYVTFQVVNDASQVLEDVLIVVNDTSENTIESKYTGASGTATFWLDPNNPYTVLFRKTGYSDYVITDTFTQTTYTITLGGGAAVNYTAYWQGIKLYPIYPQETILKNQTAYDFVFGLSSSYWSLEKYGFELLNDSGTVLGIASDTITTGGNSSLNYNVENQSHITMNWYFVIQGNYTNGSRSWYVYDSYKGDFSLLYFFDDLKAFITSPEFGGHQRFTLALIAFLITFGITAWFSYTSGVYSSTAILGGVTALSWFFAYVGFIPPILENNAGIAGQWFVIPAIMTIVLFSIIIYQFTK